MDTTSLVAHILGATLCALFYTLIFKALVMGANKSPHMKVYKKLAKCFAVMTLAWVFLCTPHLVLLLYFHHSIQRYQFIIHDGTEYPGVGRLT